MTDEQSKIERFAKRVGEAVTNGILATSDFVEDFGAALGIDRDEPQGPEVAEGDNPRLKNGLWELLNDEFDLPAGPAFEAVWADFEEVLEAHGLETEVVKRHQRVMDKLREEDEVLAKAEEIRKRRERIANHSSRNLGEEVKRTVYVDGVRFGPLSEEQIEKSARWVLAQEPGETITFESTISEADRAKIMARAQALKAVDPETKPLYGERPAEEQADTIEREADHG